MAHPFKSGLNYSNKFARIYLDALREVLSDEHYAELVGYIGIPQLVKHKLPDNLEKAFDFTYFTGLQEGLEAIFGPEKADEIALESGRLAFEPALDSFGDLAGVANVIDRAIPLEEKLNILLPGMAEVIMNFSDQVSRAYSYDEERFIFTLERCPLCWQRDTARSVCHPMQGMLEAGLSWLTGGKTVPVEIETCIAQGDEMGRVVIYKNPID